MESTGNRTTQSNLSIGGAELIMEDNQVPAITPSKTRLSWTPGSWYAGNGTILVNTEFGDVGFGINNIGAKTFSPSGAQDQSLSIPMGCTGTYEAPCPHWAEREIPIETLTMPEGVNTVHAHAADAAGKGSDGNANRWTHKVDRTAPTLELSGPLYEERDYPQTGTGLDLTMSATDCSGTSPALARSGVGRVWVQVDGVTQFDTGTLAVGTCNDTRTWTYRPPEALATQHRIEVTAKDHVGHQTTQVFIVDAAPGWQSSADNWRIDDADSDVVVEDGESVDPDECIPDSDPEASSYCGEDGGTNAVRRAALLETPLREGLSAPVLNSSFALSTSDPDARLTASQYGLSDQNARTFGDSRFERLGIMRVRRNVPYDVVMCGPASEGGNGSDVGTFNEVDAWIKAAGRKEIMISFEHRRGDECDKGGACKLPTPSEYLNAVRAFRRVWPQVTLFTAWNEPNHITQPTARDHQVAGGINRAKRAGQYWHWLDETCDRPPANVPHCLAVAGDFLDSSWDVSYLRDYRQGTGRSPDIWAWHAYGSGVRRRHSRLTSLLRRTRPSSLIWLTEQGGVYRYVNRTRTVVTQSPPKPNNDLNYLLANIANGLDDRIRRFNYYHWKGDDNFDAGLISRSGKRRETYCTLSRKTVPGDPVTTCDPNA